MSDDWVREPAWNHYFEIDGITYNRHALNEEGDRLQGYNCQPIIDFKPDYHRGVACTLCTPDDFGPEEKMTVWGQSVSFGHPRQSPPDITVIVWDKLDTDHILFEGMAEEDRNRIVSRETVKKELHV